MTTNAQIKFHPNTSLITLCYVFLDILCANFSIGIACWIRQSTLPFTLTLQNLFSVETNPFHLLSVFWILTTVLVNYSHGLYQTRREIYEPLEIWEVVKSVVLSTSIAILAIYGAKVAGFPRTVLLLTTVFMIASFSAWRIIKRYVVMFLVAKGYNNFNVLIIGAGKVGRTLVEEIEKKPGLGLKVVGFLDDFKAEESTGDAPKILGKISDFVQVARREFINKIFITVHQDERNFLKLLGEAHNLGIAVRVVPQGFELSSGEFSKYNIGFIPILEYGDNWKTRLQVGKQSFDFIVSLAALLILWPVFLAISLMIRLDSPGPAIYRSRRYGRNGKIFEMYKFRTMVANADALLGELKDKNEVDGPIFKMKSDPRVTKIGKVLRKYSLDELPQIINVLKGDMSLVGPRPLPIAQIEKEDLRQLRRLEVRPGITGLWQIRGRSDISFDKLVKWDIWYINNWSFWLDLSILIQTIPVVFKGRGAY